MTQRFQQVKTRFSPSAAFIDSKDRLSFVQGGVTVDSDDVSADSDGNKFVEPGTILYKQSNGYYKEITSTSLDHSMVFAINTERIDVTDGDASGAAVDGCRIKEDALETTIVTADKEYLGKQFVFV